MGWGGNVGRVCFREVVWVRESFSGFIYWEDSRRGNEGGKEEVVIFIVVLGL